MTRPRRRAARTTGHDSWPALIVLIALALGTGCGDREGLPSEWLVPESVPGHLADNMCSIAFDCCDAAHIPVCEHPAPVKASGVAGLDAALAANLTWDERPLQSWIPECSVTVANGSYLPCSGATQFFYGAQPEGATCEAFGHRMSDCQQGLACGADRVCHKACDVPKVAYENHFCGFERGMWFVSCAAGLTCFPDGVCRPGQALGDLCAEAEPCAVGWCDEVSSTCVAGLPNDSPCVSDRQCESNYCWEGACYAGSMPVCGRWGW
ncbi:hypothetical protein [Enhygromyxa salina]|uniref:hypothetical protein n=1 Tax=Enhygromyxa salina TaxID=215803 RepID=UPI0011BA5FBF|nr:hypothetical protein [Enhygromyxa salina]